MIRIFLGYLYSKRVEIQTSTREERSPGRVSYWVRPVWRLLQQSDIVDLESQNFYFYTSIFTHSSNQINVSWRLVLGVVALAVALPGGSVHRYLHGTVAKLVTRSLLAVRRCLSGMCVTFLLSWHYMPIVMTINCYQFLHTVIRKSYRTAFTGQSGPIPPPLNFYWGPGGWFLDALLSLGECVGFDSRSLV